MYIFLLFFQVVLCKDGDGKVGLRVKAIDKGIFVALGKDHLISFRHTILWQHVEILTLKRSFIQLHLWMGIFMLIDWFFSGKSIFFAIVTQFIFRDSKAKSRKIVISILKYTFLVEIG